MNAPLLPSDLRSIPKPTGRTLPPERVKQLAACPFCRHRRLLAFSGSKLGVFIECGRCLARGPTAANWHWAKRKWDDQALIA